MLCLCLSALLTVHVIVMQVDVACLGKVRGLGKVPGLTLSVRTFDMCLKLEAYIVSYLHVHVIHLELRLLNISPTEPPTRHIPPPTQSLRAWNDNTTKPCSPSGKSPA
jgi:hypothetical protein